MAKSKVSDPSMTKSETLKCEGIQNGLKSTFDGVEAGGQAYHSVASAKYDGKDYPRNRISRH